MTRNQLVLADLALSQMCKNVLMVNRWGLGTILRAGWGGGQEGVTGPSKAFICIGLLSRQDLVAYDEY